MDDPIIVRSFGNEQYCGCTGSPADSHTTLWITVYFISHFRLVFSPPLSTCPKKEKKRSEFPYASSEITIAWFFTNRHHETALSSAAGSVAVFINWNTLDRRMIHMVCFNHSDFYYFLPTLFRDESWFTLSTYGLLEFHWFLLNLDFERSIAKFWRTSDHHHGYEEPKTFADYIKPEYRYGKLNEKRT